MPLTLLLGSLAGIILLVLLNRLLNPKQERALLTVAESQARIHADYPDFEGGDLLLSDDGKVGLIQSTDESEYAVLVMHGGKLVSRRYSREELHLTGRRDNDASPLIQLETGDFSLPRLRFRIAEDRLRARWRDKFSRASNQPG